MLATCIAAAVVMLIMGVAVTKIVRDKKKGVTCIGCPAAGNCPYAGKTADGCSGPGVQAESKIYQYE